MKTVYKYNLASTDVQELILPAGAVILSVEEQYGDIVLYALVDTEEAKMQPRTIYIHGTGHEVYGEYFIGTVKLLEGSLMFHVFC